MSFKAAFIAHAPDADPVRHRTKLETGLYTLITVLVRDQKQSCPRGGRQLHHPVSGIYHPGGGGNCAGGRAGRGRGGVAGGCAGGARRA